MSMRSRDLIAADLARTFERPLPEDSTELLKLIARALTTVKGIAIVGFRLSHHAGRTSPPTGALIKQVTHILTGADIGHETRIGPGLRIGHPTGIVITGEAVIGSRCTIHPCTIGGSAKGSPVIGDDVAIAPGARILGDIRVDDGCHIAANAVLRRSTPEAWAILGGVPARQIGSRRPPEAPPGAATIDEPAHSPL
jgi:serine O-acetyltransferase